MAHSLTNIVRVPADCVRPARRDGFTFDDTAFGVMDPATAHSIPMVIGSSPVMCSVYALIEQAAPTAVSVLISGESGTGKELVAQTIHRLSRRAAFPFTPINAATIPETLIESELFGHEKGAFTGAIERRPGCFELADGGTLFLDEVTEMSPATQAKLLRVLQEHRFRRVGGRREQAVDVRIIAAANVDPLEAVAKGKLRLDLYYRLNVFALAVPPLRARRPDIPPLVQSFVDEFNDRYEKSVAAVDPAVIEIFETYPWPGNVRELRNVIERAMILAEGDLIEIQHLPPALLDARHKGPAERTLTLPPGTTVEQAERQLILLTMQHTGDNKTHAAALLGISVKTLYNKLYKLRERELSGQAAIAAMF
jgi:transcriptional regulator with PAS, ATPase and Fis domain